MEEDVLLGLARHGGPRPDALAVAPHARRQLVIAASTQHTQGHDQATRSTVAEVHLSFICFLRAKLRMERLKCSEPGTNHIPLGQTTNQPRQGQKTDL